MRSRCNKRYYFAQLLVGCFSLPFLASGLPIAQASDNADGATLPLPTKKSASSANNSSNPPAFSNAPDIKKDKAKKKHHKGVSEEPSAAQETDGQNSPKNGDFPPPPRNPDRHASPGMGAPPHHGSLLQALDLTSLNLSDEQKQKIQQLRSDSASKTRDLQKRVHESGSQMRDLMFDGTSSDAQIKTKSDELKRAHEQFADTQLQFFLSVRAVLTPEQKVKLKDVRAAMEQKHMDEREQRRPNRKYHGMPPEGQPGPDKNDKTEMKPKSGDGKSLSSR